MVELTALKIEKQEEQPHEKANMNGGSTKNGKDAAEGEAWQHFCSVLELSKAAVEALVEIAGVQSPGKCYAYAQEKQHGSNFIQKPPEIVTRNPTARSAKL